MLEQLEQTGANRLRGASYPPEMSLVHIEVDTDCKLSCILYNKIKQPLQHTCIRQLKNYHYNDECDYKAPYYGI